MSLHFAAREGDVAAIKRLLARGADINARDEFGRTPLMEAAARQSRFADALELLLSNGADVNASDKSGQTALMLAASRGQYNLVAALLDKGANVNAKDARGKTAIDYANPYDNVKKLLKDTKAKQ